MADTVSFLQPEPGVQVEVQTRSRPGAPVVLVVKGLGGCAGPDALVDALSPHFTVVSLSPRNSGQSSGHLTLDALARDVAQVLDHLEQRHGTRPAVVAHSLGAHVVARLLQDAPVTPRAVLLAPLRDITEQNPAFLNRALRASLARRKVPAAVRALGFIYTAWLSPPASGPRPTGLCLDQQRFAREDLLPFLDSLFQAAPVQRRLSAPSLVLLPGKTNVGLRIRELDALADTWRTLVPPGSQVETLPQLDHFLSQGGGFFSGPATPGLVARLVGFLLPR